jgi:hypothetical protein
MRLRVLALAAGLLWPLSAFSQHQMIRTFGGYECTDDCSGHKAGYEWAEAKGITDEADCENILVRAPNRTSFYEGCMTYVEDPSRGADEDDDGEEIE